MLIIDTNKMVEDFDKILEELRPVQERKSEEEAPIMEISAPKTIVKLKMCDHIPKFYRNDGYYLIECEKCHLSTPVVTDLCKAREEWEKIKNKPMTYIEREEGSCIEE